MKLGIKRWLWRAIKSLDGHLGQVSMRLTKYFAFCLAAFAASLLIWLENPSPVLSQTQVQLLTNPQLEQVVPATKPVQFTLQAVDIHQQPLKDVNFQIRLLTPAKTPWLTSDFPIVEGTILLEMEAIAPSGMLQLEQTLPIRGTYRLEIKVNPQATRSFEPFEQVLTFSVPENPKKYRNIIVLGAILLTAGLGSGWVLGGDQTIHDGGIAPRPVRMLLSAAILLCIVVLLVINVESEIASPASHSSEQSFFAPTTQISQGIKVELSGDTQATVGQTAMQRVQVTDATIGEAITDVLIRLQVIALEHTERIFTFEGIPNDTGELTWQQQFFDGAPHQVIATISPTATSPRQFSPIQASHEVNVEGVAPPLYIRLITLIYFTAFFVASLIIGLVMRRRFRFRQKTLSF